MDEEYCHFGNTRGHDIGGMAKGRVLTLSARLRANLTRALAYHRCAGGALLTITTLAPLAGTTRWTLAGLGGHTRISTLQGIAGALGCSVADLVEGVEATAPVDLSNRMWFLYGPRACGAGGSTADAVVLVSCDDELEARSYAGNYGDMSCWSYRIQKTTGSKPDELVGGRWEWDWLKDDGFTDST